ncbi:MAG: response regulator transcription factor [Bdellovibrionales bacterium]
MSRLLLVEDDNSLGATLQERLQKEGHHVFWAKTQREALENFDREDPDLIILDVGLPDGSGFQIATAIKSKSAVPFIFVTAMSTAEYRLQGYELGAEEYIPKPFHLKEFLMRVQHVLSNHAVRLVEGKECSIDLRSMMVLHKNGTRMMLNSRDFQLLKLLIERTPQVVSREEILNSLWGEDQFPSERTVDNSIVRLRQALGEVDGESIKSIRGVGYQWLSVKGG